MHSRHTWGMAPSGVVAALAGIFVLATTAAMIADRFLWPADLVNFFRPHAFGIGILLSLFCAMMRQRSFWPLALVTLAAAILPLALAPPSAGPSEGRLIRFVTANLLIDHTETGRFQAFLEEERPDVLLTQETSPLWQEALLSVSGLPHESSRDLQSRNDLKLMSRYPILSETVIKGGDRYADLLRHPMRFEVALPEGRLVVYAVHPDTPRRLWRWLQRNAYLALLAEAVQRETPGTAVIVAGDWNAPTWSPFFRDFFTQTGLLSAESSWWPQPTRFSTRIGSIVALGTTIDHVAISPGIGVSALRTGPQFGSNHLPVVADLMVPIN